MKIIIKKIYGIYDVEIDLDKQNNILIGENGIGKSTTLKILNALFNGNCCELSKFIFKEIKIFDDEGVYLIQYKDIIIPKEKLSDKIEIICLKEWKENKKIILWKNLNKELASNIDLLERDKDGRKKDNLTSKERTLIDEYKKELNYNRGLTNEDLKEIYDIKDFIKKLDDEDYITFFRELVRNDKDLSNRFNKSFEKIVNNIDITLLRYVKCIIDKNINEYDRCTFFYDSNFNDIKSFIRMVFRNSIIINMANDYDVISKPLSTYVKNDIEENELKDIDKLDLDEIILCYKEIFRKHTPEYLVERYSLDKERIQNINYDFFDLLRQRHNDLRDNKVKVDINKLLFDIFYKREKLIESNEIFNILASAYYKAIKEYIDSNFSFEVEDDKSLEKQIYRLKFFCYGFFPEKSIMYIILSNYKEYLSDKNDILYIAKRVSEEVFENKDNFSKISSLMNTNNNSSVGKFKDEFFVNKNIELSPFGMSIFIKNEEIDYYDLSSGEKKIILMLLFSCVTKGSATILLDEPENSLSIVWQKKLIKYLNSITDFSKYGIDVKFIVATQSPYVISEEEMYNDVICLPMEINNE